jgi:hypothetical protein
MDNISNAIVTLYNLPSLKQGQNGVEAAFAIYDILLDVKGSSSGAKRSHGE